MSCKQEFRHEKEHEVTIEFDKMEKAVMKSIRNLSKKCLTWIPAAAVTVGGLVRGDMEWTLAGAALLVLFYQQYELDKKISNSCWY